MIKGLRSWVGKISLRILYSTYIDQSSGLLQPVSNYYYPARMRKGKAIGFICRRHENHQISSSMHLCVL